MSSPLRTLKTAAKRIPGVLKTWRTIRMHRFERTWRAEDEADRRHPLGVLPWPPSRLRYRVHGASDRASFAAVGQRCVDAITTLLAEHGHPLASAKRVLDFGCGCGRVARFLPSGIGALVGSDIDAEAIAWNRHHLSELGTFDVN